MMNFFIGFLMGGFFGVIIMAIITSTKHDE